MLRKTTAIEGKRMQQFCQVNTCSRLRGGLVFVSSIGVYADGGIGWLVLLRVTDQKNILLCLQLMPRSVWLPKAIVFNIKSFYREHDWLPRETIHRLCCTMRTVEDVLYHTQTLAFSWSPISFSLL